MGVLSDEFLAAASPDAFVGGPALEAALHALRDRGRAAWPWLKLGDDVFGRDLGRRVGDRGRELAALHAEDLYLASGCLLGDARAQAQLDRLLPDACISLPGNASGSFADEVRQLLRQKLLVATDEGPPRIATYSGEGSLKSWLRVAAVRTALSLRRRGGREDHADDRALESVASSGPDPELDYLRLRSGADFRASFQDALQALQPRDRTLLRLYYLDGLGVERIGSVYGVHASTASRWLQGVREALLQETRRLLAERLKLTGSEVESLLGMVRSGLDVSLRRILSPAEKDG
jgi:RNA polymerase sigma-70 factor (ECF subfamily)